MSETAAAMASKTSKITRPKRNIFADRLIRDVIVQVSLVVGIALLVWFFSSNYIANGFEISWSFLPQNANVDPGVPNVLPVTSTSSVISLYGFGILNTVIVAVTGIALATILGFAMGVMRLSSNFLLSRLAQVYIEVLRNIPLTVIFLFLAAALRLLPEIGSALQVGEVLLHNSSIDMPALKFGKGDGTGTWLGIAPFSWYLFPTQFGGEGAQSTQWLLVAFYVVAFLSMIAATFFFLIPALAKWAEANSVGGRLVNRNRETLSSLVLTIVFTLLVLIYFSVETTFPPLMGWSMFAVFIIALFWAGFVRTAINNWADDKLDATGKRPNVGLLGWVAFLGALALIFIAIGGPVGTEPYVFNDKGRAVFGFSLPVTFIALIFALAIYTSAFIAEIVRSGIQSVAKGQSEAAASLGLKPGRIMSLITIPQAMKVIVPPLNSQYMNLAKNSSLALLLQIPDVIGVLRNPLNNTGRELEIVFMILLTYLFISLTISVAMNYMNSRVQVVER